MTILDTLTKLDRMPQNPDADWIVQVAEESGKSGEITLNVFVCPKFNTSALATGDILGYFPTSAEGVDDLFLQRQKKIFTLLSELEAKGADPTLNILIGDNDAQVYIFPYMDVEVPTAAYEKSQDLYVASFQRRANEAFPGFNVTVESLGRRGIVNSSETPMLGQEFIDQEAGFFGWLFGPTGPYKGQLSFAEEIMQMMALRKFQLYGAQGHYLQEKGGILLQTEGPDVWLLRTSMLRSTGASAVPAIYPWIRTSELKKLRK